VIKSELRIVLFSVNVRPKRDKERKRRKPKKLRIKPLGKFTR